MVTITFPPAPAKPFPRVYKEKFLMNYVIPPQNDPPSATILLVFEKLKTAPKIPIVPPVPAVAFWHLSIFFSEAKGKPLALNFEFCMEIFNAVILRNPPPKIEINKQRRFNIYRTICI